MTTPKFATHYENRKKQVLDCSIEPSKTLQSDAAAADINNILSRYIKTGQLPDMIKENPRYGEFADVPTYQESLNVVILAQEQFANLDASVRRRFSNDPALFLEFAANPANMKEMVKMGLATEAVTPAPVEPIKTEEVSK